MKKEDFTKLGLDDAMAEKAAAAAAEFLKGYIPKARFDEVNSAKAEAEKNLKERDGQLETLKKATGDADEMKKQIEELQAANTEAQKAHEAQLRQMRSVPRTCGGEPQAVVYAQR